MSPNEEPGGDGVETAGDWQVTKSVQLSRLNIPTRCADDEHDEKPSHY